MQIQIDTSVCQGHGQCVHLAPDLFRMGADGVSEVIAQNVEESMRGRIDEVVRSCPVEAISVQD